jgi:hypothetical protein
LSTTNYSNNSSYVTKCTKIQPIKTTDMVFHSL